MVNSYRLFVKKRKEDCRLAKGAFRLDIKQHNIKKCCMSAIIVWKRSTISASLQSVQPWYMICVRYNFLSRAELLIKLSFETLLKHAFCYTTFHYTTSLYATFWQRKYEIIYHILIHCYRLNVAQTCVSLYNFSLYNFFIQLSYKEKLNNYCTLIQWILVV